MKRSKFNLSHFNLLTAKMGRLIPIGITDVCMGDSFKHSTELLVRAQPMLAPIMHPVWVSVHHFFVPYRLMWDKWEDFITGGDTQGDTIPQVNLQNQQKGSLADYFNFPIGQNFNVCAFPFIAYNMIYNEYYRDQDLIDEVGLDNMNLLHRSWAKDYFTTARPFTQKGDEVTIPIDVTIEADRGSAFLLQDQKTRYVGLQVAHTNAQNPTPYIVSNTSSVTAAQDLKYKSGIVGRSAGLSVNDMRLALALQRYQEARAKYGSRYKEFLNYYGINSSDARLQRPEYLGGGKQILQFSEVVNTGDNLGKLGGHGLGVLKSNSYVKFFEEHGIVISLMSILPKSMYVQGVDRAWLKRTKEDFYQKELAYLGMQEVYTEELLVNNPANPDQRSVFGYQDRYDEYRSQQSKVAGDFRDTLNYWHMARQFQNTPALNADFINSNPAQDRVFVDTQSDPFLIMANHNLKARRIMIPQANPKTF